MDRREFLKAAGGVVIAASAASLLESCASERRGTATPSPIAAGPTPGATPAPVPSGRTLPPAPGLVSAPAHDDVVARENRRRGSRRWFIGRDGTIPAADGFLDRASVAAGEPLNLHLRTLSPTTIEWYRLGWYGGDGGRLVRVDRALRPFPAPPTQLDPASGMAEAPYPVAVSLVVPDDWVSGLYLAVFRPLVGAPGCAPFTVRPRSAVPARTAPAPVLFVSATATWQAYNAWGGADFYDATTADQPSDVGGRRAIEVSFDRPHLTRAGAGLMPRWELPFVRWQERHGRAVEYCADVDLELHPEVAGGRRLIVFAGHHEYWSRPMRNTIELAIATGVNVAFLSANELYWQVRLGPSPLGTGRRITCWKSSSADPLASTQPDLTTCRWREAPVNDPEAVVIGQMYGHIVERPADWVVTGSRHWLYEGTRLRDGDHLSNLVGQEFDTFDPAFAPPGTQLLARGPVHALIRATGNGIPQRRPGLHTATIYTAESGATVFAAGTYQWSWALDRQADRSYRGVVTPVDDRVARMTANLFDRLGDGPLVA